MSDDFTVEELIDIAQAHDRIAAREREKKGDYVFRTGAYKEHSARKMAFHARKFARAKVMYDG
jgi:hypothetical protein